MVDKHSSERELNNDATLRFQALLDCAGVMFVEIDTKGIVTLVNKKTCDVFGYSEAEMLGKNWFENFLPDRIKKDILPISKKLLRGELKSTEYAENPILTKDQGERIIYWHNTIIKDHTGKIIGHLSAGEDITERKKTEDLLKKSEEKFRAIADYNYDWEYMTDVNNEFIYVSPTCSRITGYKPEDFYADKMLFENMIHPDDVEFWMKHKHTIDEEGNRTPIDFRIINRNNEIQWIGHVCQNVFDSKENLIGIRGSNRLITEQKKAELHIKMLSNIVEQSSASIVITNLKGEIEYVNNSFTQITGYTAQEALGKNPKILNSGKNDPLIYKDLWGKITKGKVWKGEFINKRKDGSLYYEKAILSPIFDEQGNPINYFAIKEDITIQKRAEQLLKESEKNLKIANATKDKFFSIIAHDLRSPFNAIIGLADMLLKNHSQYDSQLREQLIKSIADSSKNTFDMLENLLEWSRSQTGGLQFNPEKYPLENIITESIDQVKENAVRKNIQLSYHMDHPITVTVDGAMLNSVLRNLISNAIKFTPKSGKIEVTVKESGDHITVSVTDNGVGMSQEKLKLLFSDLYTETTKGTDNEMGHGLGLMLCKEFVEKHGGKISVESKTGVGSTFSFTIPLA